MATYCTTARGARIAEPDPRNSPDEEAGPPVCAFGCGRRVAEEDAVCLACIAAQEEKAAENNDPEGFYADAQVDQDRLDGVRP